LSHLQRDSSHIGVGLGVFQPVLGLSVYGFYSVVKERWLAQPRLTKRQSEI